MQFQDELSFDKICIQPINDKVFKQRNIFLDVLRLDAIHPVVSGNKWFKLKYYLQQAIAHRCTSIATFGGPFSNHIIATAYACNKLNIACTGFIRGEKPARYSQTLQDAEALNMQLKFISRDAYKNKQAIIEDNPSLYFIPEGGYGKTGAKGAEEIVQFIPGFASYNYIVCAVGTGTMLAGIANAGLSHQQCIGISVMKNNFSLEKEIPVLLNTGVEERLKLLHDYHFGGYAKHKQQLTDFINKMKTDQQLPLDFVYTAKTLFGVYDLVEKSYFPEGSKIIFIHSGGLQGNRSLKQEKL